MTRLAVGIIGGGISGLACAYRLTELRETSKKDFSIVLLEAGGRVGGVIQTEEHDGFLLEKGPDAFISEKPWALDLAKRLQIDADLIGTRKNHRKSSVLRKGRLVAVPEGFYLMAPTRLVPFLRSPLLSRRGKLRTLMEYFIPPSFSGEDESLAHFVRRRFGSECLEEAAQALVAGIYTGDPETLGLLGTLPRFRDLEKKYGSVIRGLLKEGRQAQTASGARYGLFVSFKKGMATLTDALEKKVSSFVRLNSPVRTVSFDENEKLWHVTTKKGETLNFDAVCTSLPARDSRKLLAETMPVLAGQLSAVKTESVATVHLAYRSEQFSRLPQGFGFVAPKKEKRAVLACTFVDQKFEGRCPEGMKLLRAFVGGAFGREFFNKEDKDLTEAVEKDLQAILGIQGKPVFSLIRRHPEAMVQYGVGHYDWLEKVRRTVQEFPGLFLTGASYAGVGIPDCVRDAESQAENIFHHIIPA